MSAELKPCLFCGSEDLTHDNLGEGDDWYVSCNVCEVQQIANYKEDEAIERWNRRDITARLLNGLEEARGYLNANGTPGARYFVRRIDAILARHKERN